MMPFHVILLLLCSTNNNLLRSPGFMHPVIPSGILYFEFPSGVYFPTRWIFSTTTTYVPYSYPHPMPEHPHHPEQALFVDDNNTYISQPLLINIQAPIIFKIFAEFRMPEFETNGTTIFYIDQHLGLTLKFHNNTHGQIIKAENFIVVYHIPLNLFIRSEHFEGRIHERRNGFQVFKIGIEISNEKELHEHSHEHRVRHKRSNDDNEFEESTSHKRKN